MLNACIFLVAGCCGWFLLAAKTGCCCLLWLDVSCCGLMLLVAVACCQLSASLTLGKYIGLGLGSIIYI